MFLFILQLILGVYYIVYWGDTRISHGFVSEIIVEFWYRFNESQAAKVSGGSLTRKCDDC